MTVEITSEHIWELHNAEFAVTGDARGSAVLAVTQGEIEIMPPDVADGIPDARIVLTAADLWVYCDGELNPELADQLAADLTRTLDTDYDTTEEQQ